MDRWSDRCMVSIGKTIQHYILTESRGLVATFQAFQKGLGPFMATRLLLG